MPALNEIDYAKFNQMLEELEPEVENMKETPRNFLTDMIQKNHEYGERVFVSPKQLNWIKQLHEEYIGSEDHSAKHDDRGDFAQEDGPDPNDPRFR